MGRNDCLLRLLDRVEDRWNQVSDRLSHARAGFDHEVPLLLQRFRYGDRHCLLFPAEFEILRLREQAGVGKNCADALDEVAGERFLKRDHSSGCAISPIRSPREAFRLPSLLHFPFSPCACLIVTCCETFCRPTSTASRPSFRFGSSSISATTSRPSSTTASRSGWSSSTISRRSRKSSSFFCRSRCSSACSFVSAGCRGPTRSFQC